ncbi:MAG: DUF1801 domain-containing protein [Gammaproteobacteria bacterium]|nr:DUF1801 domain-containing protein [Gammaproteobacteria bacterium]
MVERKTHQTKASVKDFLSGVSNLRRRKDSEAVVKMMRTISRKQPRMWGPSIIGFGRHQYRLANGKDAEICKIGFSPRSQALAFYLSSYDGKDEALSRLGKHKRSKGCLYINKLDDVDQDVLKEIITNAYHQ